MMRGAETRTGKLILNGITVLAIGSTLLGCGSSLGKRYPDDIYRLTYLNGGGEDQGCLEDTPWDTQGKIDDATDRIDWDTGTYKVLPKDEEIQTLTFNISGPDGSWEITPDAATQAILEENNCPTA